MKKLYIDIRFAKCILALTAGWLMAGCSAEDELENGSATQQLSMTPMVNDLQTTRVKEEENLHEKTLSSLDFKMFEPTSSERRIDSLFDTPAENKAEELGSGDWKSTLHLDVNNTYPYYAVANAKENLKDKNLKELLASTQQDDDIWKPATMVNDKKFLMSSQGKYTITSSTGTGYSGRTGESGSQNQAEHLFYGEGLQNNKSNVEVHQLQYQYSYLCQSTC